MGKTGSGSRTMPNSTIRELAERLTITQTLCLKIRQLLQGCTLFSLAVAHHRSHHLSAGASLASATVKKSGKTKESANHLPLYHVRNATTVTRTREHTGGLLGSSVWLHNGRVYGGMQQEVSLLKSVDCQPHNIKLKLMNTSKMTFKFTEAFMQEE
jgi:hypothetical protein